MKIDILAIGVHPDDVELSASGTLLKHLKNGRTVGLLDLTRGELGSRGTAEIRDKEAEESAIKMGALFRRNLGMADGFFAYTKENLLSIIQIIRWCQPEIVLANAPDDRHPDHGRAAKLCADACFYSGLIKIETVDEKGHNQKKWRPKSLYHYVQDKHITPDFVVDISEYIDEKIELILTFQSQFHLPSTNKYKEEIQTPISGKQFMDFMRAKNQVFGRPIQADYAEGFLFSRTVGVEDLFNFR